MVLENIQNDNTLYVHVQLPTVPPPMMLTHEAWVLIQCFASSTALTRVNRWLRETVDGVVLHRYFIHNNAMEEVLERIDTHGSQVRARQSCVCMVARPRCLDVLFSNSSVSEPMRRFTDRCCKLRDLVCVKLMQGAVDHRFLFSCGANIRQLSLAMDNGAHAHDVRSLLGMRSLEQLKLQLSCDRVDVGFATAVASLSQLPELTAVKLEFNGVRFAEGCLQTVVGLFYAPRLIVFAVEDFVSEVPNADWLDVARMWRQRGGGSTVRNLSLLLESDRITDDVVHALVQAICGMPRLQKVDFSVCDNALTARSGAIIGRLGCLPNLRDLAVCVTVDACKPVTPEMAQNLLGLSASPSEFLPSGRSSPLPAWTIHTLELCLTCGSVTDAVVRIVTEGLSRMRHLRCLTLALEDCNVTDVGALDVAGFLRRCTPAVTSVKVWLSDNAISDVGARYLWEAAVGVPSVEITLYHTRTSNLFQKIEFHSDLLLQNAEATAHRRRADAREAASRAEREAAEWDRQHRAIRIVDAQHRDSKRRRCV